MFRRNDILAVGFLAAVICVFFFDLLTFQKAFTSGDHRDQQYPWAKFFQQQIHEGKLPWWTTEIHAGFPLLAEGQIGAFYPLNWAFFYFLPAKQAYNLLILFQYFLGSIFFYAFLRQSGRSIYASVFAALIWLFGSTQGGYFYYNYISQKVAIWLPLILILIDKLLEKPRLKELWLLAAFFAIQIFAGYLQIAVYCLLYAGLYFLFFWIPSRRPKTIAYFFAAGLLGVFYSLIQLIPTYELSLLSSRANAAKEIAYLGSMHPFGFFTLFYPSWDGFLGSEWYLGLLGLFFAGLGVFRWRDPKVLFFVVSSALFALLALGKFGGIYALIVEVTNFHSFRTPAKFLFFAAFSMAVLSAYGVDGLLKGELNFDQIRRGTRFFLFPLILLAVFLPIMPFLLEGLKPVVLPVLKSYVANHVYGKPGHAYTLDYYMSKAEGFYQTIQTSLSLQDAAARNQWLLSLALFFLFMLGIRFQKSGRQYWKAFFLGFLLIDLYAYGYTSIRANFGAMEKLDPVGESSQIIEAIRRGPGKYRSMEIYTEAKQNEIFPFFPCSNMTYGIEDLGGYSPLAMKKYAEFLSGWGYVNDSLTIRWMEKEKVLDKLPALGLLNVKYLLSTENIEDSRLIPQLKERSVYLYKNNLAKERVLYFPGIQQAASLNDLLDKSAAPVRILDYRQQEMTLEVNAEAAGLLFVPDILYPGWKAAVDGKIADIQPIEGLFRSLRLDQGLHEIKFYYDWTGYRNLGVSAILLFCVLGIAAFFLPLISGRRRLRNE